MHSALLVFKEPEEKSPDAEREWSGFLGKIENVASQGKSIQRLAQNCLLIPLDNGASLLSELVQLAAQRYPHRILFFEDAPQWVQSATDDKWAWWS